MTVPPSPKVAGIDSAVPAPTQTVAPSEAVPGASTVPAAAAPDAAPTADASAAPLPGTRRATAPPSAAAHVLQDRLAGWISDLTTLHELTERLAGTALLRDALHELLRAGATLVGARRALVVLEPSDGLGPDTTVGLGLTHADLGHIETVPRSATSYGRLIDGPEHPADHPRDHPAAPADRIDRVSRAGQANQPGQARQAGQAGRAAVPHTSGSPHPRDHGAARPSAPRAPYGAPAPPRAPDPHARPGTHAYAPSTEAYAVEAHDIIRPDLMAETGLHPRHREVMSRLGCAATYALPLTARTKGRLGAVVWLYDEPARPTERRRHLVGRYVQHAAEHLARLVDLERARTTLTGLTQELLPARLPQLPGVRLAARRRAGTGGGSDWYDALALPDNTFALAVGSVPGPGPGPGPGTVAAMSGLRAGLRAYAVMEGEDPVAVLSDLELLLRLTDPARSATVLYAYCEPSERRITLAGAGHAPPLVTGAGRTEFVETSLSAPLGMLSCWEAPSVQLHTAPGETVLLCTDGLLRRAGEPMDCAYGRLHAAAAGVPARLRDDPGAVADHVLRCLHPAGTDSRCEAPGTGGAPRVHGALGTSRTTDALGTGGGVHGRYARRQDAADGVLLAARFE